MATVRVAAHEERGRYCEGEGLGLLGPCCLRHATRQHPGRGAQPQTLRTAGLLDLATLVDLEVNRLVFLAPVIQQVDDQADAKALTNP